MANKKISELTAAVGNLGGTELLAAVQAGDTKKATVAQIDHDTLAGFVAGEHILHSGVTLTAGEGLTGGGDISASRSFALNVSGLTGEAAILAADQLPFYDASATAHRKITFAQINAALDHDALTNFVANKHLDHSTISIVAGAGLSGGGDLTSSRTLALDINSLTAETAIDTADLIAIYDASAAAHRKITRGNLFSGTVFGPGSATDEGIARYDGTTGKLIQDSGVAIDDSGIMTWSAASGPKIVNSAFNNASIFPDKSVNAGIGLDLSSRLSLFSANVNALSITSASVIPQKQVLAVSASSAATPDYSFFSDSDTGMYSAGADILGLSTGGTQRINLTTSDAQFVNLTGSLRLPSGTTAQRTGSPAAGDARSNTTLTGAEFYDGAGWFGLTLGPAASTTTAVATWDGTSGNRLKNTGVTIDASDNVTIPGDLTVNGTTVTVNTSTISVEDPLIKMGNSNAADSVDLGFYAQYTSGVAKYTGLFRDASASGKYRLFKDLEVEPTTTVDIAGTGYAVATLISNLEGDILSGNWMGTTIPIAAGGTGQTTQTTAFNALSPLMTTGDLVLHNGANNVRLPIGTAGQVLTVSGGTAVWAGISFPLLAPLGSAAAPSYSFSGDDNTGIYSSAADTINFTTAGVLRAKFDSVGNLDWGSGSDGPRVKNVGFAGGVVFIPNKSISTSGFGNVGGDPAIIHLGLVRLYATATEVVTTVPIRAPVGSVSAPSYSFTSALTTGMYLATTDALGLVTAGAERVRIDAAGLVGIGIASPTSGLHVNTSFAWKRTATAANYTTSGDTIVGITSTAAPRTITLATADLANGRTIFVKDESGGATTNNITIDTQGSETIDGAASVTITANYGVLKIYSDGANWYTL